MGAEDRDEEVNDEEIAPSEELRLGGKVIKPVEDVTGLVGGDANRLSFLSSLCVTLKAHASRWSVLRPCALCRRHSTWGGYSRLAALLAHPSHKIGPAEWSCCAK